MLHKCTMHTGNQLGPPSLYMDECRHIVKMSTGILKVIVGNAQKDYAFDVNQGKVNPIGGDGWIDTKWMDCKCGARSAWLKLKIDKHERNQCNSNVDDGHRVGSVCQCVTIGHCIVPLISTQSVYANS